MTSIICDKTGWGGRLDEMMRHSEAQQWLNFTENNKTYSIMRNFAFTKINYILLIVGLAIIVAGFILMSGDATTEEAFNPAIFSDMHIKVAPMVCLVGFLFEIAAILWPASKDADNVVEDDNDESRADEAAAAEGSVAE